MFVLKHRIFTLSVVVITNFLLWAAMSAHAQEKAGRPLNLASFMNQAQSTPAAKPKKAAEHRSADNLGW